MKYILLLFAFIVAINVSAQKPKQTKSISGDSYGHFWGTASDTVAASDTLYMKLQVNSSEAVGFNFALQTTKVSGTVTNNVLFYGTNVDSWTLGLVAIDTIALSNAASGTTALTAAKVARWTPDLVGRFKYIVIKQIAGATAQRASYKMYYITRHQ